MLYIQRYGLPAGLYVDRAGHFKVNKPTKAQLADEVDAAEPRTQIQRAAEELGVELIFARSAPAKGRVERQFDTCQDRLVRIFRVQGITTIKDANKYLEDKFLPWWQKERTVKPTSEFDAHRPARDYDLKSIFSIKAVRVVSNDYTFRLNNRKFQIAAASNVPNLRRGKVTVETRVDNTIKASFNGKYLLIQEI